MDANRIAKRILSYLLIFAIMILIFFSFTILCTLIPKEKIKENMKESADYMYEQGTAHFILVFIHASFLDYYADSITLSIAYNFDEEHPVESSMWASYYGTSSNLMPEYLKESVENDPEPNTEYMRYWHGSASLMRLSHLILNVKQVFVLHAVFMSLAIVVLMCTLWRHNLKGEATCFLLSMIVVSIWYVPLCLEYFYAVFIMIVASIAGVKIQMPSGSANREACWNNKDSILGAFFLITGMFTAYFDFLTAETLTLLIPLLFILRIRSRQSTQSIKYGQRIENGQYAENGQKIENSQKIHSRQKSKKEVLFTIKSCLLWSIGYVGAWVMKWILAALILHQDMLPFITEHIAERLDGDIVEGLRPDNYILAAIARNLKCLFPYEYGISGAILVFAFIIVVVILPVAMNRIRMKKEINRTAILLYVIIGIIPFIRFTVLHNHAYRHYIFTHRALAATVLAISFIVLEVVEVVGRNRKAVTVNAGSDHSDAMSE